MGEVRGIRGYGGVYNQLDVLNNSVASKPCASVQRQIIIHIQNFGQPDRTSEDLNCPTPSTFKNSSPALKPYNSNLISHLSP